MKDYETHKFLTEILDPTLSELSNDINKMLGTAEKSGREYVLAPNYFNDYREEFERRCGQSLDEETVRAQVLALFSQIAYYASIDEALGKRLKKSAMTLLTRIEKKLAIERFSSEINHLDLEIENYKKNYDESLSTVREKSKVNIADYYRGVTPAKVRKRVFRLGDIVAIILIIVAVILIIAGYRMI